MAAVEVQASPIPTPAAPPTLPRKRRRRVPASGASDDCFSCRKRNTKCDRKRPYCTQCIDMGKDCSGYRTTLTWGVGVASRGKLRGQSLPIAKKSPPAPTSDPTTSKSAPRNASMDSTVRGREYSIRAQSKAPTSSPSPVPEGRRVDRQTMSPMPASPSLPLAWQTSNLQCPGDYHIGSPLPEQPVKNPLAHGLHRLITTRGLYEDSTLSTAGSSIGSASSYADSAYGSPLDFPSTPDCMPFSDNLPLPYANSPVTSLLSDQDLAFYGSLGSPTLSTQDDISSIGSSDPSLMDPLDGHFTPPLFNLTSLTSGALDYLSNEQLLTPQSLDQPSQDIQYTLDIKDGNIVSPQSVPTAESFVWNNMAPFGLAPRMQYLLDYYDKAVCPNMVAFDGPTNPYRVHVLNLAQHNPALQNAVAALAMNNMRRRSENVTAMDPFNFNVASPVAGGPTDEEIHYKNTAVRLLDAQLADARMAQQDSVLVTLLILCLFHVSDSGVSKFKTQIAGVQKLLSLRQSGARSEVLDWVQMYFTWFDVMTATVNDREIEVDGTFLDLNNLSTDLGNFEEFTGCDGRLFKLIARLSRLNLLSQNRPVKNSGEPNFSGLHQTLSAAKLSPQKDYYSLDGNGWNTPISTPTSGKPDIPTPMPSDDRHEFWAEWRDVRERLQGWERDQFVNPTMCSASLPTVQRDIFHMSEAFRYAALLYTERLAYPHLNSSSLKLQNLVAQGLYHISEIAFNSCVTKYLLWPLFILGTECTVESHRGMVREKCLEIHRQSGFHNNLACVEVLDKVWLEYHGDNENNILIGAQPFKWRQSMDATNGEYIII